jgi:hypothetical protein
LLSQHRNQHRFKTTQTSSSASARLRSRKQYVLDDVR